ncbi:winged helix-turn-helix domain-containing protein [Roseobacter sp. YSTF-M11]|uniref:Winged helix-turn-helix domain-containing protein n=1 Tax=Roseobacter insulae TaxID=2859783 RepID=A0A9X1FZ52_9RHOB|nr:winged helix-turn-helix domain-containing protein [Roseobacter insulae]MBW4709999.1 winged helix-turn-helix domain-containing protein [Roseobacter insulae]
MTYHFDDFCVDTDRREITGGGQMLRAEPQVFDLLVLLISNHHRFITKDELLEKIWRGRFVSESALTSRIKSLRQLLGDNGQAQKVIRTLRGKGFRFVADVKMVAPAKGSGDGEILDIGAEKDKGQSAPSIAVLPFDLIGDPEKVPAIGEAIPRELIASLSSLRWLKVIAQGSTFRFRGSGTDVRQLGDILGARYCLTGSVEILAQDVVIDVELSDTRTAHVVWAMRKQARLDRLQELRAEIVAHVISVAELEIPQHEAARVQFSDASNLDAWSAMHVGLQKIYQFSGQGNLIAKSMFERAIALEPTLGRAHAGLAFVHFQAGFMRYEDDVEKQRLAALRAAERAIELQPRDPFANFMMGRCHWLDGDTEGGKPWFERATQASPNYALGYYGASWANIFSGDYDTGMANTDRALSLSPLDPMRPGMTGGKMWVNIARENLPEAVKWAEIAAHSPGAHAGMAVFAAMSHWLNGDAPNSARWLTEAKRRNPQLAYHSLERLVPASHAEFHGLVRRFSDRVGL